MSTLLVFTNLPDRPAAERLAEVVLREKAAACVNILSPCQSLYRWKGRVERAEEHPVLMKTTPGAYDLLEAVVRAHHPYELPEIIAVPVERGLPAYLAWVSGETGSGGVRG